MRARGVCRLLRSKTARDYSQLYRVSHLRRELPPQERQSAHSGRGQEDGAPEGPHRVSAAPEPSNRIYLQPQPAIALQSMHLAAVLRGQIGFDHVVQQGRRTHAREDDAIDTAREIYAR